MSCENVQELISSALDGKAAGFAENALAHLDSCRSCNREFQSARNLRRALRTMGRPAMPQGLTARLRVMASHERERQLRRMNLTARFEYWRDRCRLAFDNLARPLALPFAGGLLSTLLLLGVWVPTLASKQSANDVPLPYWVYTDASLREFSPVTAPGDVVATLTINERGRVAGLSVNHGELTPELAGAILVQRYKPAMVFGQPVTGKLVVRISQISVRG